jgi:hypothetical protein|uniref:Uncharacterized protein n=1 Tax=Ignisphaera aggregans TaxID=334771 RepID=A0A7J2U1J1_9CREN
MSERCTERASLYDIEGYAQAGLVNEVKYINCGKGKTKILITLANGKTICSECIDQNAVELSKKVIELYRTIKLQK